MALRLWMRKRLLVLAFYETSVAILETKHETRICRKVGFMSSIAHGMVCLFASFCCNFLVTKGGKKK